MVGLALPGRNEYAAKEFEIREAIDKGATELDMVINIGMLKAAGLSVCMANGTEDAKAAADRIVGDVREDGLADLIEELWFGGPRAEPTGKDLGSAWGNIESAGGSL